MLPRFPGKPHASLAKMIVATPPVERITPLPYLLTEQCLPLSLLDIAQ